MIGIIGLSWDPWPFLGLVLGEIVCVVENTPYVVVANFLSGSQTPRKPVLFEAEDPIKAPSQPKPKAKCKTKEITLFLLTKNK